MSVLEVHAPGFLGSAVAEISAVEFTASVDSSALPRLRRRFGMGTTTVDRVWGPVATKLLYSDARDDVWLMLFRMSEDLWRLRIFAPGPAEAWAVPERAGRLSEWMDLVDEVVAELGGSVETRYDYTAAG